MQKTLQRTKTSLKKFTLYLHKNIRKSEARNKNQLGKKPKQQQQQQQQQKQKQSKNKKQKKQQKKQKNKNKNSSNRKSDSLPTPTYFPKDFSQVAYLFLSQKSVY